MKRRHIFIILLSPTTSKNGYLNVAHETLILGNVSIARCLLVITVLMIKMIINFNLLVTPLPTKFGGSGKLSYM